MKLFGRKISEAASRTGKPEAPQPAYRLTLELKHAETFAAMLAKSRAARAIEIADLLAGMYICNWDRLSKYWKDGDEEEMEVFLRRICRISPQRWHSWLELYDRESGNGKRMRWPVLKKAEKAPAPPPLRPSAALASVLTQAAQIAPAYDRTGNGSLPILTSECVLLCIVRNFGSEIGRKLATTGLDAEKLQEDALFPRRPPIGR